MTTETTTSRAVQIPERLYFRIGDVAELAGVKPYVLRYWESEFPMISPGKSNTGQRVYRRGDVETILMIKHLLYVERYSIEGARKRLRELRRDSKDSRGGPGAGNELDSLRETVVVRKAPSIADEKKVEELKGLANDLKALSQTPITKIFGS